MTLSYQGNLHGSTAVNVVIVFVVLGLLIFAGFQAYPILLLKQEHQNFRKQLETQVQAVPALVIPDTQTQLTETIANQLNAMGAQYEPQYIQVEIEKAQRMLVVQVWYTQEYKSLFFPKTKMFYVRAEKAGFADIVKNEQSLQSPSAKTASVSPHTKPAPEPSSVKKMSKPVTVKTKSLKMTFSAQGVEIVKGPHRYLLEDAPEFTIDLRVFGYNPFPFGTENINDWASNTTALITHVFGVLPVERANAIWGKYLCEAEATKEMVSFQVLVIDPKLIQIIDTLHKDRDLGQCARVTGKILQLKKYFFRGEDYTGKGEWTSAFDPGKILFLMNIEGIPCQ